MNRNHQFLIRSFIIAIAGITASACTTTGDGPGRTLDPNEIYVPPPRVEPVGRAGNASEYTVLGETYRTQSSAARHDETGFASWYGKKFHGRQTANGEEFDMYKVSAAHRTLPLPTWVQVTNLDNGKSIPVRINDRGPFSGDRIMDLSYAAAVKLGMQNTGVARVRIESIDETIPGHNSSGSHQPANSQSSGYREPTRPASYSTPRKDHSNGWYVQVASFGNRGSADQLANGSWFSGQGQVHSDYVGDRTVHRVRLGPFSSRSEAETRLREIRRDGYPDAFLVSAR